MRGLPVTLMHPLSSNTTTTALHGGHRSDAREISMLCINILAHMRNKPSSAVLEIDNRQFSSFYLSNKQV